jgi:hypothetical protein
MPAQSTDFNFGATVHSLENLVAELTTAIAKIINQRDKLIDFVASLGYPYDFVDSPVTFPDECVEQLAEAHSAFSPEHSIDAHFAAIRGIIDTARLVDHQIRGVTTNVDGHDI